MRGDWLQVARVAAGDAYPVGLEKALRTIQALGGQFVVAKAAQQLAHQDVCQLCGLPVAHVCPDQHHAIFPPLMPQHLLDRDLQGWVFAWAIECTCDKALDAV